MSGCGVDETDNQPVLRVQLRGRGEDAMRMDKRLRCAGRALGVRVEVEWDAGRHGDPEVWIDDDRVVDHLVDTPRLEALLKPYLPQE